MCFYHVPSTSLFSTTRVGLYGHDATTNCLIAMRIWNCMKWWHLLSIMCCWNTLINIPVFGHKLQNIIEQRMQTSEEIQIIKATWPWENQISSKMITEQKKCGLQVVVNQNRHPCDLGALDTVIDQGIQEWKDKPHDHDHTVNVLHWCSIGTCIELTIWSDN